MFCKTILELLTQLVLSMSHTFQILKESFRTLGLQSWPSEKQSGFWLHIGKGASVHTRSEVQYAKYENENVT